MAAAAAARAAISHQSNKDGGQAEGWSLDTHEVHVIEEEDDHNPFPHCVPHDGELYELMKSQMKVFKQHLKHTIHHNDVAAMESLNDDFAAILFDPFAEKKDFKMTKLHKIKDEAAGKEEAPVGHVEEEEQEPEDTGLDKFLFFANWARSIIVHPYFATVMILAICMAGLLVGIQVSFDCGSDASGTPYLSCRVPEAEQAPCLAGGSLRNMTMDQCAAQTCCWKPANGTAAGGTMGTCWARVKMPECYDSATSLAIIGWLDLVVLLMFTGEMCLKIVCEKSKPWRYWTAPFEGSAGWNTFDSVVVLACWHPRGDEFAVLRLARLTRVLKLLDKIEQLKIIMNGLGSGMSSVVYILIMLFLVYYVFAIICMMLFRDNDPVHFGELHISLVTLFRMSTMEDWTDVMYINMWGCNAYGYQPSGSFCFGFNPFPDTARYYGAANRDDGLVLDFCTKPADAVGQSKSITSKYRGCAPIPAEYTGNPEAWPERQWSGYWAAGLFTFFIVIAGLVVMSLFIGVITTAMQIASDEAKEARKEKRQEDSRARLKEAVEEQEKLNEGERPDAVRIIEHLSHFTDKKDQQADDENASGYATLALKARALTIAPWFTNFITGCILAAGVLIGMQTYKSIEEAFHWGFIILDTLILVAFIVEIVLKIIACGATPAAYIYGQDPDAEEGSMRRNTLRGWNMFDFTVVVACLMPESIIPGGGVAALRLLRLLRVLKLFNKLTQLQIILMGLAQGMGSVVWIALLMSILYYVFACAGISFFRHNDPIHFANLGTTFVTLFRCSTLEDWTDVMYVAMYGCKQYNAGDDGWMMYCENNDAGGMFAALFFILFILLSSLVMLNLIVGVVCSSMQEATDNHEALSDKTAKMKLLSRKTGIEMSILKHWEKEFFKIDDSDGFGEGNIAKEDLKHLLKALNEEALMSAKGREHLLVKAYHSVPSGKISLLDFLETMAKDLANLRHKGGCEAFETRNTFGYTEPAPKTRAAAEGEGEGESAGEGAAGAEGEAAEGSADNFANPLATNALDSLEIPPDGPERDV